MHQRCLVLLRQFLLCMTVRRFSAEVDRKISTTALSLLELPWSAANPRPSCSASALAATSVRRFYAHG